MSINFRDAVPAIVDPLERAAQADWVRSLNETAWLFAMVETAHLLFLVVLGGAVAVLNLRLLGAVLRDVPEREVEAATRPWFLAGVIGTVATGIYMGVAPSGLAMPRRGGCGTGWKAPAGSIRWPAWRWSCGWAPLPCSRQRPGWAPGPG